MDRNAKRLDRELDRNGRECLKRHFDQEALMLAAKLETCSHGIADGLGCFECAQQRRIAIRTPSKKSMLPNAAQLFVRLRNKYFHAGRLDVLEDLAKLQEAIKHDLELLKAFPKKAEPGEESETAKTTAAS
jgi:hypothetical protein